MFHYVKYNKSLWLCLRIGGTYDKSNMERGTSGKKDMYERIINTHLNVLRMKKMAVFLALHEEGGIEGATLVLDMPADEVVEVIERYIPKEKNVSIIWVNRIRKAITGGF